MYEFIFVVGGRDTPFTIIQNIPYRELVPNSIISELELGTACVLTVAEKADSPDPVSYFRIEVSQFVCLFVWCFDVKALGHRLDWTEGPHDVG